MAAREKVRSGHPAAACWVSQPACVSLPAPLLHHPQWGAGATRRGAESQEPRVVAALAALRPATLVKVHHAGKRVSAGQTGPAGRLVHVRL